MNRAFKRKINRKYKKTFKIQSYQREFEHRAAIILSNRSIFLETLKSFKKINKKTLYAAIFGITKHRILLIITITTPNNPVSTCTLSSSSLFSLFFLISLFKSLCVINK